MELFKRFATTNAKTKQASTVNRQRYWWISNEGNVKITDNYSEKTIWPKISLTGGKPGNRYAAISLNIGGKYIHKIVAAAFLGPKPNDTERWVVDHIDENRLNNNVDNLQWLTNSDNLRKYWRARKANTLQEHSNYQELYTNITESTPRADRDAMIIELYTTGISGVKIRKRLGLSHNVIWNAIRDYRALNNITKYNSK